MGVTAAAAPLATTATTLVRDGILEARARGDTIRIVGGGRWLDAGRPVTSARTLELGGDSGIVEYVPGDFTLTARAGTRLDDIARATAAHHQWLPIEPFGTDDGTLGATVATASFGPLAHAYGTPRDHVLGIEAVTGAGSVIRAGGRVVKNVAGFDLTRLFIGSWGTLGAITEVSVRLRARPAEQAHLVLVLSDDRPAALAELGRSAGVLRAEPLALELVSAPLAARLGLAAVTSLLVRLGGNAAAVAAQVDAVAGLGRVAELDPGAWTALRSVEPPGAAVMRLSGRPSMLPHLWAEVAAATTPVAGALVHASVGRGVVRVIVPSPPAGELATVLHRLARAGTLVIERLPPGVWSAVADIPLGSRPDEQGLRTLQRRVKDAYDPMHLLNPGILGEAIA